MTDDPRIRQLLEELLTSQAEPEDVCRACPELLPEVRRRWRQMCLVRAQVDALFPDPANPDVRLPTFPQEDSTLPQISGYEVEALIGRGGMGVVFRARQLRLNRVVALKMMLAGAYAGPRERERFQREAEAVAGLRHPNIVQIHDVGDSDGRPYFTMEFVEGSSLAEKLAGTPQPAREAAALLATLAGAVHAAHQSRIVHRDLKPANILLTADGTPKISDFGLARRLDGEAGLTRTGTALGTPSYMAPEQARGNKEVAAPAADIYALGAILYELLTGRPPFRAETGAETVYQLLTQDPVPPSRLNGKVPRDLETICLKCLHKEPRFRYATAAALADDLGRFLGGEMIAARPEGQLRRLARRVRRRPVLSAALSVSTLLLAALFGGGLWVITERSANRRATEAAEAATEKAATDDVQEMVQYLNNSFWPEARAALERARGRLGNRGSPELRRRMDQGQSNLDLALKLEAISFGAQGGSAMGINPVQALEFEAAFRDFGVGQVSENPEVVAARIRASDIRNALILAVDQWALYAGDLTFTKPRQKWLLEVARLADTDPSGWRALAGDLTNLNDLNDDTTLNKLVETVPRSFPSIPILIAIKLKMDAQRKDPLPLLKRLQERFPDDFTINYQLGMALANRNPTEALRYFQAALSLRPNAVSVNLNIGNVLQSLNRLDEALVKYRRVEELAPTNYSNHATLAAALSRMGRYDEAEVELRRNVTLVPTSTIAQNILRLFLLQHGRPEKAVVEWKNILAAHPTDHDTWYGYAELCLFLGREDEYRSARQSLLSQFGTSTDPMIAERTSRACLLLPAEGDELRQAVALAERAVRAPRSRYPAVFANFLFAQVLAEYRQGKFDRAISLLQGEASRVLGPAPRLVLAMALHRNGGVAEARKALAEAVLSRDWRADQVRDQDDWIYHVLRREAEALILPNLPAFLEGKYQPQDNEERLALLGVCQFTNHTLALARLYATAFAADPRLGEDIGAGHRYNAARAAALVGCGRGTDATGLSEDERRRWRDQARLWLWADLTAWGKSLDNPPARPRVLQVLTRWRTDPDLAGLREPAELDKLPADERKDCLAFWDEVGGVLNRTQKAK